MTGIANHQVKQYTHSSSQFCQSYILPRFTNSKSFRFPQLLFTLDFICTLVSSTSIIRPTEKRHYMHSMSSISNMKEWGLKVDPWSKLIVIGKGSGSRPFSSDIRNCLAFSNWELGTILHNHVAVRLVVQDELKCMSPCGLRNWNYINGLHDILGFSWLVSSGGIFYCILSLSWILVL